MFTDAAREFKRNRFLLIELVKRSYQDQNKGTYLGSFWTYFQPLAFIAVLYYIITVGFRDTQNSDIGFGTYLVCGMVCWLFFSRGLSELSNLFRSYSYLIKKVDFDLRYLPVVKLLGLLPSHLVMICFSVIVALASGFEVKSQLIQLPYYIFCSTVLLFGLGLIVASVSVFIKDVSNLVALLIQFGFWLTPIFWSYDNIDGKASTFVQLNPVAYLVDGYRDSVYRGIWFWEKPELTLFFWCWTLVAVGAGLAIFKRVRPHIAEVL